MKVGNIIALTSIAIVGYAMHAMRSGESSAMGAARGAGREVPSLQQFSARKIAQMLHDNLIDMDEIAGLGDFNTKKENIKEYFALRDSKKSIAEAYYRLYPEEFPFSEQSQSLDNVHTQSICALAFSPDGNLMASGGDNGILNTRCAPDNTLKIWSRKKDNTFELHQTLDNESPAKALTFSADGKFLVAGLKNGTIKIWPCNNENKLGIAQNILNDGNHVHSVAFSPDSEWLAIGLYRATVQILRRQSNGLFQQTALLREGGDPVGKVFVAFLSQNELLTAGSFEMKIWSQENNLFVSRQTFRYKYRKELSICCDPKGDYFVYAHGGPIEVYVRQNDNSFAVIQTPPQLRGYSISLSLQGLLAVGLHVFSGVNNLSKPWSQLSAKPSVERRLNIASMAFSPSGDCIAMGTSIDYPCRNSIKIWSNHSTIDDIWNHIISKYLNPPSIDARPTHVSPDVETKKTLLPPVEMPALEESPDSTVQNAQSSSSAEAKSAEGQLADIEEQKKAIKANTSLTQEQKEEQLNALRARERELKKECKEQGTCGIQ